MLPSIRRSELSSLPEFVANPDPEVYLSDNYIVLDFECTNRNKGSAIDPENRLLVTCCRLGPDHPDGQREIVSLDGEYGQSLLLEYIERADFVVAHNTKFELQWLKRCGLDLRSARTYCTQIGEYVRAGNRKWRLSLEETAKRFRLGGKHSLVSTLIKGGVCPSEIPKSLLVKYCRKDVELTEQVFLEQRKLIRDEGLLPVTYCRNLFTPVLASMEFEGMYLDKERVENEYRSVRENFEESKRLLDEFTGGINQNSPKQLREYLYTNLGFEPAKDYRGEPIRTGSGQLSVGKSAVACLKAHSPEQRTFLELYKRIIPFKKRLQILRDMKKCCEEDDGHLFAEFNQTITQTHRLSSNGRKYGFQFHNFPRDYKRLFSSGGGGWLLVEGDAPQLEFRVAVDLGNDQRGIRAVCDGVDVHALTASIMRLERTPAKAYTFKPLYGGVSGTPAERRYYEAFRREYASVYNEQQRWVYEVLRTHSLTIASGLKFFWPDTKMRSSGYVTNTPSIFNYPIQSFATADIVPLCVICLWYRVAEKADSIRLVNTVHDSAIALVHESVLKYFKQALVKAFTEDIYGVVEKLYGRTITVPLGVGIKAGEHWGEGDEEKFEAVWKRDAYLQSHLGVGSDGA